MGREEPQFTVVSNQPEKLASGLEAGLKGVSLGAVRCVSQAGLKSFVLLAHEILIIDFASMSAVDSEILDWQALSNHLVLGLIPVHDIEQYSEYASVCTEQLMWPAKQDELEGKLKHLSHLANLERQIEQTLTLKLNLVGESECFQQVVSDIKKYSKCDAPVLIAGETGTGKEKIARAIHYASLDDGKPFVVVNCAALPDSSIEDELYGYAKNVQSDARQLRRGLFEQAEGGTLFLDEIEALGQKGQLALLYFLQNYEYCPLGASETIQASLRLIVATNESMEGLVERGSFRKDLYYRINILTLELPPLRERGLDITLLAEHFIDKYRELYEQYDKYLDRQTLQWMSRYDWPGNVRELENLILREFLLAEANCITISPPDGIVGERRRNIQDRRYGHLYGRSFQDAKSVVVSEFERSYLIHVLKDANGNVSQAAKQAGKERKTFSKLLDKYGFSKKRYRD